MSKNSIGISYAEYKRRNGVVTRKKQSHHQKPNTVVLIKQLLLAAAAIIAVATVLFSTVTVEKVHYVVEPGDTVSEIMENISTQVKKEHDLSRIRSSGFSDDYIYGEWFVLQPGDMINVKITSNAIDNIFNIGCMEYHLIRAK